MTTVARVPRWLAAALGILLAPAWTAAQECAPLEVPSPPVAPEKCKMFDGKCKGLQRDAVEAARTFTTPIDFGSAESTTDESSEIVFRVTGCAGAVVAPVVKQENLTRLELSLTAPSGTPLLTQDRSIGDEGSLEFAAVELPQSGRYTIRLRVWARPKAYEVCTKTQKGEKGLSRLLGECVEKGQRTGYPRTVSLRWRGSAGLKALELGEEWRPVLESAMPTSRRVHLDADVGATVRIESASRLPVAARVSVARGGIVTEQKLPTGVGEVKLPAKSDEQVLILRFSAERSGVPATALLVTVDSVHSGPRVRVASNTEASRSAGASRRALAAGASQTGRLAPADGSEEWEFSGAKGEQYLLQVIPSGRAGLVVRVAVYNAATEELLVRREQIAARLELPVTLPAAGHYVVEVSATGVQSPDGDGRALYTVALQRRAR